MYHVILVIKRLISALLILINTYFFSFLVLTYFLLCISEKYILNFINLICHDLAFLRCNLICKSDFDYNGRGMAFFLVTLYLTLNTSYLILPPVAGLS